MPAARARRSRAVGSRARRGIRYACRNRCARLDGMAAISAPRASVRVALEEPAVLERAGLALVAVDRHQARAWYERTNSPFLAGRKARRRRGRAGPTTGAFDDRLGAEGSPSGPTEQARSRRSRGSRRARCTSAPRRRCAVRARDAAALDRRVSTSRSPTREPAPPRSDRCTPRARHGPDADRRRRWRSSISRSAPAIMQLMDSQTRIVTGAGRGSPS